jgi:diguanylate cyclase (GGDEF)-like protein
MVVMRLSISTRLFYSHFLVVLLVSGAIGSYFYITALDSLLYSIQARLKNSAALLSPSLDATSLDAIRGPEDSVQPAYQRMLRTLRDHASSNADIAFIYIMRRENGRVSFVVDSDDSPQQAVPGKTYQDVTASLLEGFRQPSADEKVVSDEWGDFLSGYAPLKTDQGEYLVGIDMRADVVSQQMRDLRLAGLVSLLLSIVLAVVFSRLLAQHFHKPIPLLIAHCREIAEGTLGKQLSLRTHDDELDQLIMAFNDMSQRLDDSRAHLEQVSHALQESRDQLEVRVIARTAELEQLNRQLRLEVQERQRVQKALLDAARTDSLTGLLNRRAMLELLEYEANRTRRQHLSFCVVLIDIDHFKRINDNNGHDVGDRVLVHMGELLRDAVRAQDAVARWGGEEMLLLLPATHPEGARQVAEKIRAEVEAFSLFIHNQEIKVTLSLGVSEFTGAGSIDDCIKRADVALYQAKSSGRNAVALDANLLS